MDMTKKLEQPLGVPVSASEVATMPHAEYSVTYENAPGEFPVIGFEPLEVPKGFTIAGLLKRIEALEQSQGIRKSSAKIDG